MKFYPHSKIKTDNLPTLLFSARATSVLGYIFSLLTIFLWVSSIFLGPRTMYGEPNSPILSVTWNGAREYLPLCFVLLLAVCVQQLCLLNINTLSRRSKNTSLGLNFI